HLRPLVNERRRADLLDEARNGAREGHGAAAKRIAAEPVSRVARDHVGPCADGALAAKRREPAPQVLARLPEDVAGIVSACRCEKAQNLRAKLAHDEVQRFVQRPSRKQLSYPSFESLMARQRSMSSRRAPAGQRMGARKKSSHRPGPVSTSKAPCGPHPRGL